MRRFLIFCSWLYLISLGTLSAAQLPQMRPALLGKGRDSLINLIDTENLVKRGQGDAVVRFTCAVNLGGEGHGMVTYRRTPNSDALAQEAVDKCRRARFIPAVYDSRPVWALLSGTIIFVVIDSKPHLRIFLNQEGEHVKKGDDFISPQEVFRWNDKFDGFVYPPDPMLSGTVCVKLDTDAAGQLLASRVTFESPAGAGFGRAVMDRINKITFLPGYLNGRSTACSTTWQILFRGRGRGSYWNTD